MDVYSELTTKYDELQGPTSKKQIYDKNRNDKRKTRMTKDGRVVRRGNFADHIFEFDTLVAEGGSIVRSIIRDQGKAPCLILYNDDQLTDIKNICCTGQTPLGIDKTFNLCDMHVTATCYKQTSVVMESTGEAPIFLGPLYIHDNSDFETYSNFFNHLKTKLTDTDTSRLVFGSDEEKALVNAITTAFPNSEHMLCKRHLYQNTKQKLVDDCVDKTDRQDILDMIYGEDGLINADDTVCFDQKSDEIEEVSKELSVKFLNYYQKKLKDNIKEKVNKPLISGFVDRPWTNNNSESLNHILKQAINWKSQPLADLISTLTTLLETQFKDLKKSLVRTGQYRLADTHKQFEVSKAVWVSKTTDERDRHFKRFRNFMATNKNTVTSTDGRMTVVRPKNLGKKKNQRKRKINERTTTYKKRCN
jgi:transposase-like protein